MPIGMQDGDGDGDDASSRCLDAPLISYSMATKNNNHNCSSRNPRNSVRYSSKRQDAPGVKSQTIDQKRQKKTVDGLNDANMDLSAPSGGKSSVALDQAPCAFCHSSKQSEGSGSFVAYAQGKEVTGNVDNFSKVIHVHLKCLAWTPRIYFEDGLVQNLESEIIRANKLKCSSCGTKGAGLGCSMKACQKTYHVPCAYGNPGCRWDDGFLILCPNHAHHKFPSEQNAESEKKITQKRISKHLNLSSPLLNFGKDLVFCGSGLSAGEKFTLVNFASSSGAIVFRNWRDNVTHVIAGTDSNGACTRTLNVLMAILHGRWILTTEWVKACVEAGHLVKEEPYEVVLDNHGSRGGPKAGRLRVQNNAPKLFNRLNFYFIGEYAQAYKADLVNLVTTGGGTITETKDQLLSSRSNDADTKVNVKQVTLVVYNADFSYNSEFEDESTIEASRLDAAEDVAREFGCRVVPHIWILESIACGLLVYNLL